MSDHIYLNDLSRTYTCHQVRVQGQNTNSPGFVYTMEECCFAFFSVFFKKDKCIMEENNILNC